MSDPTHLRNPAEVARYYEGLVRQAETRIESLQADNARLREQVNAIIAIAESYECLAQNPAVETSVSQERLGFAQDIYQSLGIESEAGR